jgi:hypothetical protein
MQKVNKQLKKLDFAGMFFIFMEIGDQGVGISSTYLSNCLHTESGSQFCTCVLIP